MKRINRRGQLCPFHGKMIKMIKKIVAGEPKASCGGPARFTQGSLLGQGQVR